MSTHQQVVSGVATVDLLTIPISGPHSPTQASQKRTVAGSNKQVYKSEYMTALPAWWHRLLTVARISAYIVTSIIVAGVGSTHHTTPANATAATGAVEATDTDADVATTTVITTVVGAADGRMGVDVAVFVVWGLLVLTHQLQQAYGDRHRTIDSVANTSASVVLVLTHQFQRTLTLTLTLPAPDPDS
jgi:hypothetical protein